MHCIHRETPKLFRLVKLDGTLLRTSNLPLSSLCDKHLQRVADDFAASPQFLSQIVRVDFLGTQNGYSFYTLVLFNDEDVVISSKEKLETLVDRVRRAYWS